MWVGNDSSIIFLLHLSLVTICKLYFGMNERIFIIFVSFLPFFSLNFVMFCHTKGKYNLNYKIKAKDEMIIHFNICMPFSFYSLKII